MDNIIGEEIKNKLIREKCWHNFKNYELNWIQHVRMSQIDCPGKYYSIDLTVRGTLRVLLADVTI